MTQLRHGFEKGTKSWKNGIDSLGEQKRLYLDLTISNKNHAHPVSFKRHAIYILPAKSCGSERIDRANAKLWVIKNHNVSEDFFQKNVLHHDLDGTMMYVDKKLHSEQRHLGYFFFLKFEQQRKMELI